MFSCFCGAAGPTRELLLASGLLHCRCPRPPLKLVSAVCRLPCCADSTNANIIFPKKVATREVDGVKSTGVFAIDLTWEEVQKLEAVRLTIRPLYANAFILASSIKFC